MQHKKWSVLFSLAVGFLSVLLFVLPVVANVDPGWDWPEDTPGQPRRTLTYCVEGDDVDFVGDVNAAAQAWNDEGLGWTLNEVADCESADIVVKQADLQGVTDGRITLGSCLVQGSEGEWKGTAQGATIRINSHADATWGDPANPGERNRVRTIMHEFGHAMRLDHTFGSGDVMKQSTSGLAGTGISDEDRREARTAVNYTVGGTRVVGHIDPLAPTSEVVLYPLPGAEATMNLTATYHVWVEPFFDEMETTPHTGWEYGAITVTVSHVHSTTIGSHAGITVLLNTERPFHAEIPVTADPLLPNAVPQAGFVITPQVALAHDLIRLDARPSTHSVVDEYGWPESEAKMTYRWKVTDRGSDAVWYTYHDYGALFLPVGAYTVTLILEDQWGQVDELSQSLTVHPHLVYVPLIMRDPSSSGGDLSP